MMEETRSGSEDLERVLDVPLELHVELGKRRMRIADLLAISTGAVLELEAAAGSTLAIFANDVLIARGEAVVVGERYGVRVTEIVSPRERMRRLGEGGGLR